MKLLDSPRTGRLGSHIFYPSPFGQCCRALTVPHDPKTPAQSRARAIFGSCSNAWGRTLTEAQRLRWVSAWSMTIILVLRCYEWSGSSKMGRA